MHEDYQIRDAETRARTNFWLTVAWIGYWIPACFILWIWLEGR